MSHSAMIDLSSVRASNDRSCRAVPSHALLDYRACQATNRSGLRCAGCQSHHRDGLVGSCTDLGVRLSLHHSAALLWQSECFRMFLRTTKDFTNSQVLRRKKQKESISRERLRFPLWTDSASGSRALFRN